jgi:DNA-binding NtrC family response regulator
MSSESLATGTTEENAAQEHPTRAPSQPYLFVVLHCDRPLLGGARHGLADTDLVTLRRGAHRAANRRQEGERRTLELLLPGATLSSTHALLGRGAEGWVLEDQRSKNGTFVNGEPVKYAVLRDGDFIEVGPVILRYRAALTPAAGQALDFDSAGASPATPGLLTLLPRLAEQLAELERIARMPVPVLLFGETGSGKEVLARGVHALSGRAGPLVAVNCGGLPASLLESQLFGHVKGSFTGAHREEAGYIRSAGGGTLFLDEVGDLPLPAQATLLRALQEHEVVPVGSTRPVKVDLRVVAATHKPLELMVVRGEFRADLLARLSGYRHQLAPLRERLEDFGLLISDLLRSSEVPGARDVRLRPAAGLQLLRRSWPLNIRELQQCLAVAATLAGGGVIEAAHLPDSAVRLPPVSAPASAKDDPESLRRHLVALLEKHRGKVSHVARDMHKARMQIHRWMHQFGIDPDDYRE